MIVQPLQPITVQVTNSGQTTILPVLAQPGQVYQIHKVQLVNRGSARPIELLEGTVVRWRGEIPKGAEITIDWGIYGWRFVSNTSLFINSLGTPFIDVNVLSHALIRV